MATATVLALGLAACGSASGGASSSSDSPSGSQTIRLGVETGAAAGITNDIATAVLTEMGYKVEPVPMAFEALIPSLQSGRIDVAGSGLYITPARCKTAAFAEPSVFYLNSMAVPKGNPHNLKTFEDVAKTGVNIGVSAGTITAQNAKAAGVQESQISTYQDLNTMLDALLTGRIDAVPFENFSLNIALAKPAYSGLEATPPTYPAFDDGVKRPYASGLAFKKADTELAKKYSEKQTEFFKEGTKAAEIGKKYDVPAESMPKGDDAFKMADYCAHAGV